MDMQHSAARAGRSALPIAALAAALLAAAATARAATDPSIALVGATVVGTDSGTEIPNAVVLISADRIVKVGPADSIPIPEGAQRISLQGKRPIPGLMNMHVHLGLKLPGAAGDSLTDETDTQEVLRMAGNARRSLLAGVTTLRLVGEDHGTDFALRAAIDRGEVLGPRIKTAGEVIVPTGGHGSMEAGGP